MRLVVLDGGDYRRHRLVGRRDAVLVDSARREEDFSCNSRWAARTAAELAGAAPLVGVGSSLGALALLHLHWTRPGPLAGLLLQSGSFFHERTERYERDFRRFDRIHRFVDRVLAGRRPPPQVPVTLTVGLGEQNRENNRPLAEALAAHGWDVRLVEHPGDHDWDAWRLSLREELPRLLRRVELARRG
jgi:enterochelin esterase family protein